MNSGDIHDGCACMGGYPVCLCQQASARIGDVVFDRDGKAFIKSGHGSFSSTFNRAQHYDRPSDEQAEG